MLQVERKEFYEMEMYYFNVYAHIKEITIWLKMFPQKSNGSHLLGMLNYEQKEIILPLYIICLILHLSIKK